MNFYILKNKPMPWGDYGDLLLSGLSYSSESGQNVIKRTGPYVPPIVVAGLWDLIISNELKNQLEKSVLTGFKIEEVKKEKIVEIHWENWTVESDEPEFYPRSGEPEDYIFEGTHSDSASNEIGELWIMKLQRSGRFENGKITFQTELDFFLPENKGFIIASERAKQWLENRLMNERITFELLK